MASGGGRTGASQRHNAGDLPDYICAPCICFTFLLFIAAPYTVCRGVEVFIQEGNRAPVVKATPSRKLPSSDIPDLLIPCMAVL